MDHPGSCGCRPPRSRPIEPSGRHRRIQIIEAFARVLAAHGYAGATIAAVAEEAGIAPALGHHYFTDKAELRSGLLAHLIEGFRHRTRMVGESAEPLPAYVAAAVRLDATADATAARCRVGVLAEAIRSPTLFAQVRRLVDSKIEVIRRRSSYRFSPQDAGGVLAFVIGSPVLGAFAPRKTAGFAHPALQRLIESLGVGEQSGLLNSFPTPAPSKGRG